MHSQDVEKIVRSLGRLINPQGRAKDGSSACTIENHPFDATEVLSKWLEGPEDIISDTSRSTALLAAYAIIFGDGIRPEGLPTSDDKWFRPDHSVVRACIRAGDMELSESAPPILMLADKGFARVARALSDLAG